ncbi:hypothetical protein AAFF_G00213860 [Aldrovandia affinis]|uniref:Uncharacterized protein n=1 Tax=Aldrovandia affinis TaxID=143900 RepID=A0AAD7W588_9TELE|nr:hypothetical protein AAFF_G00213860 [Aldrovandia affinis]
MQLAQADCGHLNNPRSFSHDEARSTLPTGALPSWVTLKQYVSPCGASSHGWHWHGWDLYPDCGVRHCGVNESRNWQHHPIALI